MKINYIPLKNSGMSALINPLNGQLVSLYLGRELIHPGGRFEDDPKRDVNGWANSGLIMFPIVGASKDNIITYAGENYNLDQHGMIRSIMPTCSLTSIVESNGKLNDKCTVNYNYKKNTDVNNIKYMKGQKNPKMLRLPLSFDVSEEYTINAKEKRLEIKTTIKNISEKPFCYALGRHPAFISNTSNSDSVVFYNIKGREVIRLVELMKLSKTSAHIMHGEKSVTAYDTKSKKGVKLWTDFGNIMLWSPKENMFCIEPITERIGNNDIEINLSMSGSYKNILKPFETKEYYTYLMIARDKK